MGTALGAVFGGFITFNTEGLDFALTALFVVLLIEQMKDRISSAAAVIGLAASLLCLCLFSADKLVLSAMAFIIMILITGRKQLCGLQRDKL